MTWELDFLNWINESLHGWEFLNVLLRYITALGDGGFIWFVLGIVLVCIKKTRVCGLTMLAGMIVISGLNNYVVKLIVQRLRPMDVAGGEELRAFAESVFTPIFTIGGKGFFGIPTGYSFMSGHTVSSCLSATILFLYNKKIGIPAIILGATIALSRLYFGVHYPTDVLCGAAFGIGGAFLVTFVSRKIVTSIEKKKSLKTTSSIS